MHTCTHYMSLSLSIYIYRERERCSEDQGACKTLRMFISMLKDERACNRLCVLFSSTLK